MSKEEDFQMRMRNASGKGVSVPLDEIPESLMFHQEEVKADPSSDREQFLLAWFGWHEGEDIPSNIAELSQKVVDKYRADNPDKAKERIRLEHLPKEYQRYARELYRETMLREQEEISELDEQIERGEIPDAIAESMREATEVEEEAAEEQKEEEKKEEVPVVCNHCGRHPFESITPVPDKEDKKRYIIAIGTGKSFQKEYSVFNNIVTVRFRALRSGEFDLVDAWSVKKAKEELGVNTVNFDIFYSIVNRYQQKAFVALQTAYLKSNHKTSSMFWQEPEGEYPGLGGWKKDFEIDNLDSLIERFEKMIVSEALFHSLKNELHTFNQLERVLGNHFEDPNFWQGI